MSKSTTVITQLKKKPGPKPTGKGKLVGVRVHPDMMSGIDAFLESEPDLKSRPDAIREILKDWLIGHGHLKP